MTSLDKHIRAEAIFDHTTIFYRNNLESDALLDDESLSVEKLAQTLIFSMKKSNDANKARANNNHIANKVSESGSLCVLARVSRGWLNNESIAYAPTISCPP